MADRRARKRRAEIKDDEFFHIRAKGQFLKVPKGQEFNNRVVTPVGKCEIENSGTEADRRASKTFVVGWEIIKIFGLEYQ